MPLGAPATGFASSAPAPGIPLAGPGRPRPGTDIPLAGSPAAVAPSGHAPVGLYGPGDDDELSEDTVMRAPTGPPVPVLPPAAPVVAARPARRWPLIAGAGAAAAVLGGVLGFFVLSGIGSPDVLDPEAVATASLQIVKEDFGLADATDMTCPAGQKVVEGHTFVCTFAQGSHRSSVQIVVTSSDGTYLVGGEAPEKKP